MESIWKKPELSEAIIKNDDILEETQSIVADFMASYLDISILVENMAGVLTHKEPDNRLKGIRFFTKLLKDLPKDYLSNLQVNFISTFYVDRLKDYHKVIPYVLEGYLYLVDMKNYTVTNSGDFFMMLFREVPCQSQVRQDRYNIYLIIQKILNMDADYVSKLGPDFVYGVISSMDGERDPRNLLFMFTMLPKFIKTVQLGHLVNEMFEIMSCYFPVDFHPSPTDPAPVQRNDLAEALAPCLCASQEFSEQCLLLLIEKLDSSLRVAKIDAFHLLAESCKTFTPESYGPFLKSLWSSLTREISHKSDEDLRMAAHEALFALVANQSKEPVDRFENFVKGIIIAMQTSIAEATTIAQFIQTTRVIATTANASQESCVIVTKCMIPSMIGYYGFQPSPKLQIASLDFLGELYELAKHWDILHEILKEAKDIPHVCLTAVSSTFPDMQYAGFKTLIKVKDVLDTDLVLPFVEVLIHNIQHSQSPALLALCVEAVHAIARKYPELIMGLVVKGKCDLDHLTQDKVAIEMRLNLLSNLASIDEFTKVIIQEMLKIIMCNDSEACRVVEALNGSISNTSLYTDSKVNQIESDHGLINSVLSWLYNEIGNSQKDLSHGYSLISNTVSSLSLEKQLNILLRHTSIVLERIKENTQYYFVLEALYSSLHQGIHTEHFPEIMNLSLDLCLKCECEEIRSRACVVVAHFLNKVEPGTKYEYLYELLRNFLSSCDKDNMELCPRLITLYGWLTKALIMRGSDAFQFWLQKIMVALKTPTYCKQASESIKLITTDFPEFLTTRQHCRVSILYKQRLAQTFISLLEKYEPTDLTKESYLLSWAYVLDKMPKSLLNSEANKITSLIVESLDYKNSDLLLVTLEVLSHYVNTESRYVADSLQTLLPRLMNLTKFDAMSVRIKSLQCAYDIANVYPTVTLLPYKQDILFELAPSLDDKKRLVRAAAVKARTRWFMIGAPGEAKDE